MGHVAKLAWEDMAVMPEYYIYYNNICRHTLHSVTEACDGNCVEEGYCRGGGKGIASRCAVQMKQGMK
jgi:hypothetical protein